MLAQVLPDDVNIGYHEFINGIISKVNGKTVVTLEDLITAFETWDGDYHVVEDIRGFRIVLNRTAVEKSHTRILKKYKNLFRPLGEIQNRSHKKLVCPGTDKFYGYIPDMGFVLDVYGDFKSTQFIVLEGTALIQGCFHIPQLRLA